MKDAFYQEVALHWRFRDSPGFARIYGYGEAPYATIVMKYYALGSLTAYVKAKSSELALQYPYSRR